MRYSVVSPFFHFLELDGDSHLVSSIALHMPSHHVCVVSCCWLFVVFECHCSTPSLSDVFLSQPFIWMRRQRSNPRSNCVSISLSLVTAYSLSSDLDSGGLQGIVSCVISSIPFFTRCHVPLGRYSMHCSFRPSEFGVQGTCYAL